MKVEDLKIDIELLKQPVGERFVGREERITIEHLPTGLKASANYGPGRQFRNQHKARDCAFCMLEYGLAELGIKN